MYYSPKRIQKLAKATGISVKKVKSWLKNQPTAHCIVKRVNFIPRVVMWCMILMNNGKRIWLKCKILPVRIAAIILIICYILTVIDIFSRYAWARLLKSKRGEDVAAAFRDIFREGRIPKRVHTDQGHEFENRQVRALFDENRIELFSVKSAYKAALVERFNHTLKHLLWRNLRQRIRRHGPRSCKRLYMPTIIPLIAVINENRLT